MHRRHDESAPTGADGTARGQASASEEDDESLLDLTLRLRAFLVLGRKARSTYERIVHDLISATDPLALFPAARHRSAIRLVEATHLVTNEAVGLGDRYAIASEAPLAYARWAAWQAYRQTHGNQADVLGDRRSTDQLLVDARSTVVDRLRDGWTESTNRDGELERLLLEFR